MSSSGFYISRLTVRGTGKSEASLEFRQGLNVVAGASNTGKTYAWQAIDFMLGSSTPPKDIPPARGFAHCAIELYSREGGISTIWRALAGGGALEYGCAMHRIDGSTPYIKLGERHESSNEETISGRLLGLTGLIGKEIRKNAQGAKKSLSFRDVARLVLVDEERIITDRSPVLSGQYIHQTEERSTFGLFVTGIDDAAIVTQETQEQRKARLEAEKDLLQRLIDSRENKLKGCDVDVANLRDERKRLENDISEASRLLAAQQAEINRAAEHRDKIWMRIQEIQSRRLFLGEQVKRLELLREHYQSDSARLESALEAGELFERLPQGMCPVCGHTPSGGDQAAQIEERLKEFQTACKAELAKISVLSHDLAGGLDQMRAEDLRLCNQEAELGEKLEKANAEIDELQKIRSIEVQLSELLKIQNRLNEAAFIADEISDLRAKYSAVEQSLSIRIHPPKFALKVDAAGLAEFCDLIAETLKSWKFPPSKIAWSEQKFDLIIGNENRGSLGKGRRAITHAAFTISLMRYCRMKGLPHPGIVVLDTPLNPYKGPDKTATEGMNMEVQEAFYSDLASDPSGDQVIVFENTEPTVNLRPLMKYEHFSGTPGAGRVGFFPDYWSE